VNEATYADNALWADQLDEIVSDGALCVALGIGKEVAQVTNVTLGGIWGAVVLGEWVDCVGISVKYHKIRE
jgi:hypothetical protein